MKKVLISVLTIIFIISMITVVNAASGSISLTASANQVAKGNTFTVTLAATADENITGLESSLTYDTNKLSLESKSAGVGFSDLSGDSTIDIASIDDSTLSTSATLYTLTFKVLDTAEEGETTINVTNATLALINNQTQENVTVEDGNATITIITDTTIVGGQDESGTGTGDGTGTTTGTGTGTQTPSTTTSTNNGGNNSGISSGSSNYDTSDTGKQLPQTGVEIVSIIAIAGLSVFAVISYVLYKKYNNI